MRAGKAPSVGCADTSPKGGGSVVLAARSWLGTPYRHQASVKGVGADCLGLVRGVWREVVGEEPETTPAYSADWAEVGGRETLLEAAGRWMGAVPLDRMRAGDVLLFRMSPGAAVKHCAILSAVEGPDGGVDAASFKGAADPAYLAAGVAGGDGFDWFYASEADRAAQVRTPIVDTAHGEDWVFRAKDLKGWWSNRHHDRPGGVRAAEPTAWVPGMKPVRLLEPVVSGLVHEDGAPRGGDGAVVVGAPFVRVLDLPPLMGAEEDGRPLVAVAAEPWRAMRLFAGSSAETLTARADVETSATVGVLIEPLAPGVRHRWDEANALTVRVEGAAPESLVEVAVLGGGNSLAVETATGWEVVQFRTASLVSAGVWRLTGLLRGQQGTEMEMRAGAAAGAVVVFLDPRLARAEIGRGERGLPLVCRAGPAGAAPGGSGFSEIGFEFQGLSARPWSPVGLGVEATDEGLVVRWTPRVRLYGDGWDGEPTPVDPMRFRLRVIDAAVVARTDEAVEAHHVYAAGAVPAGARIAVSQWGEGFGWGVEAEIGAL